MTVVGSALVIAGYVTGIIGIVLAARHHEGEEVSKWLAVALGLLAVGTIVTTIT